VHACRTAAARGVAAAVLVAAAGSIAAAALVCGVIAGRTATADLARRTRRLPAAGVGDRLAVIEDTRLAALLEERVAAALADAAPDEGALALLLAGFADARPLVLVARRALAAAFRELLRV
jgi:hypothetical protein